MTTKQYQVGDRYFMAHGTMGGRAWDIDTAPCETREEAEEEAQAWLSWLSQDELKTADTYVREYRVLSVEEDGTVGSAETCD